MYDLIEYHIPEAIRIEVIKVDNSIDSDGKNVKCGEEDVRRFSVDPQITPLAILQSLLVRAFNLQCDFSLSYLHRDIYKYCSIQSDVDLDSAYLKSSLPFLQIRLSVDKNNSLPDWDIITISDVARSNGTSIANTLINQVEKFMNKALANNKTSQLESFTAPLNDNQFRNFLDSEGKIKCARELRIAVYRRGVDPSLRKVVWKHLLNVYPSGLTGQQRIDFMKLKCETYCQMRNLWQVNQSDPVVESVINMVKKDVMRTDRCHHYYYGNSDDDNENVITLLNILTTYALNHKDKYCQGMSDLASPLLYAMKDESHAYICFCALMTRLSDNFNSNGEEMSRKFAHLSQLLQYYDPEFYSYLRIHGAHELLFCYRWILLELKREFAFDDTLYMLEVLWSSIPPTDVNTSLHLFDDGFLYIPQKNIQIKNDNLMKPKFRTDLSLFTKFDDQNDQKDQKDQRDQKLKLMRAQQKSNTTTRPRNIKFLPKILSSDSRDIESPDEEDFTKSVFNFPPRLIERQFSVESDDHLSETNEKELQSNTNSGNNENPIKDKASLNSISDNDNKDSLSKALQNVHCNGEYMDDIHYESANIEWKCPRGLARSISCESLKAFQEKIESYGSLHSHESRSSFCEANTCSTKSSSCSSLVMISSESCSLTKSVSLLSPKELGANNAFMLFLCLTILLQNRDKIINTGLDANDIQMYFDGLVRKNDVITVLDYARHLFHSYLSHWHQDCQT